MNQYEFSKKRQKVWITSLKQNICLKDVPTLDYRKLFERFVRFLSLAMRKVINRKQVDLLGGWPYVVPGEDLMSFGWDSCFVSIGLQKWGIAYDDDYGELHF